MKLRRTQIQPQTLRKISLWTLFGFVALLPILFLPGVFITIQMTKIAIALIAVTICALLLLFALFGEEQKQINITLLDIVSILLVVILLASSLISPVFMKSFLGYGFEMTTTLFWALGLVLAIVFRTLFKERKNAFYLLGLYVIVSLIIALFVVVRTVFDFGLLAQYFPAFTATPVGKWNDLGILFAITALISSFALDIVPLRRWMRIIAYIAYILAIFMVALINITYVWLVLGIVTILATIFVYVSSHSKYSDESDSFGETKKIVFKTSFAVHVLILFIISAIFFITGGVVSNPFTPNQGPASVASVVGVSEIEVRPGWSQTMSIAKEVASSNIILGTGPNTFQKLWTQYRPMGINQSNVWNLDFIYGVGLVPTVMITTGLVGLIGFLALITLIAFEIFKVLFKKFETSLDAFISVTVAFSTALLWALAIIYVPGVTMMLFVFVFTGLLFGLRSATFKTFLISETKYYNHALFTVTVVVMILLTVYGSFMLSRNVLSSVYFQRSLTELNRGNVQGSFDSARVALNISEQDRYYRLLSQIALADVNQILAVEAQSARDEEIQRNSALASVQVANQASSRAVDIDRGSYQNWLSLASVYRVILPNEEAYTEGSKALDKVDELYPTFPQTPLIRAQYELALGDVDSAKDYITKAIERKPNYPDAAFMLSQIEISQGNINQAINSLTQAINRSPNEPLLYFQVGILEYESENYQTAADAFLGALQVSGGQFANAQYFLGLSLQRLGNTEVALSVFQDLQKRFPENEELKLIISNLQENQEPFVGSNPPIPEEVSDREGLPLEDDLETEE